jgi:hypothetical protein
LTRVLVQLDFVPEAHLELSVERPVRLTVVPANDGSERRAADLVAALREALLGLTRDAAELAVEREPPDEPDEHRMLVWVGNDQPPAHKLESLFTAMAYRRSALAVLPRGVPDAYRLLPPRLADVQVAFGDPEDVTTDILAAAGLIPREHRVFISYSHADGIQLAHAVYDLLQRGRFDVFLDVASLEPGQRFAERIEHSLVDKAFLLLVETDAAVASEWVRREVSFARTHRLGLAAIRPASATRSMPGIGAARRSSVDGQAALVSGGEPTAVGKSMLRFVRELHSQALVRRRASIENSLKHPLSEVSLAADPAGGGFAVATPDRSYSIDLQPRPAVLADFEQLDRRAASDRAVLISPRTRGAPERAAIEWLASRSGIVHAPETRLHALARAMAEGRV